MNSSNYKLSLDVQQTCSPVLPEVKQGDTKRELWVILTDGGAPYPISEECYAVFTAAKPDGTFLSNPCRIQGNTVVYALTPQTVAAAGVCDCEIKLYGADDGLLTSARFGLLVHEPAVGDGDVIQSETEVNALTQLISDAAQVILEGDMQNMESRVLIGELEQHRGDFEQRAAQADTAAKEATLAAAAAEGAAREASLARTAAELSGKEAEYHRQAAEGSADEAQLALQMTQQYQGLAAASAAEAKAYAEEAAHSGGSGLTPSVVDQRIEDHILEHNEIDTQSHPDIRKELTALEQRFSDVEQDVGDMKIPTKVSQLQNDAGYLTEHQDISGKLDADKLPEAVDSALAQAKASGEFDGPQGEKGDKGDQGDQGEAGPAGKDGANGVAGKDGVSATHSWNGTVLTVTSASGTSSADLKGDKGDKGEKGDKGDPGEQGPQGLGGLDGMDGARGPKGENGKDGVSATHSWNGTVLTVTSASGTSSADLKGDKGDKGDPGTDGKTPVKGVDYWTEADQEAVVQQVIAALGTPVFGRVDGDKNIILTGELADGVYTLTYEDAEGNTTQIGTLTLKDEPAYTNILPLAINSDKTPFVGANGEKGYKTGYRLNSSGAEASVSDWEVTGFIPITTQDVLYFKNIQIRGNNQKHDYIGLYNASFSSLTSTQVISVFIEQTLNNAGSAPEDYGITLDADNNLVSIDFKKLSTTAYGSVSVAGWANVKYIRFSCFGITEESVITKNEPVE